MANQLINQSELVIEPAPIDPNAGLVATFGYHADGRAEVHYLAHGASLPDGWYDSPAAAEAVTAPTLKVPHDDNP